jgi:ATP-dependent RNA helicase DeaD
VSAPFSSFADLGLPASLLQALSDVGYESPSPIQAATIPPLLEGRDLVGQAQTGTGKTAAFALPALAGLDISRGQPQVLVLTPTRELAIQVAEAFQRYAAHLPGFHVLPIYGGTGYGPQLAALRRGVHVVVATPGRLIDHIERGSIRLDQVSMLVLDEADEMLRMGFVDDVEAILQATPPQRQVALFSATMPPPIRRIAERHLKDPASVTIQAKTRTADKIRQRCWWVSGLHKLDALTRILEAETFEAMIVFVRTKQATEELAEKLEARGFAAAAINGDIAQQLRERTIERLRNGQLDILVATDVAARGLDVDRISHVLNYDIPYDTESYVHRIGRTGRAGRTGEAILFVAARERHLLRAIERATNQPIEVMSLPSVDVVNDHRLTRFKQRITDTLALGDLAPYQSLIEAYEGETGTPTRDIAAALARMVQGDAPLLLKPDPVPVDRPPPRFDREHGGGREHRPYGDRHERGTQGERPARSRTATRSDANKTTFRVEVGHQHGVRPGNLVGAIANEISLDSGAIGRIDIRGSYSLVDLPDDLPADAVAHLGNVWVAGQRLRIRPWEDRGEERPGSRPPGRDRPAGPRRNGPPARRTGPGKPKR